LRRSGRKSRSSPTGGTRWFFSAQP